MNYHSDSEWKIGVVCVTCGWSEREGSPNLDGWKMDGSDGPVCAFCQMDDAAPLDVRLSSPPYLNNKWIAFAAIRLEQMERGQSLSSLRLKDVEERLVSWKTITVYIFLLLLALSLISLVW